MLYCSVLFAPAPLLLCLSSLNCSLSGMSDWLDECLRLLLDAFVPLVIAYSLLLVSSSCALSSHTSLSSRFLVSHIRIAEHICCSSTAAAQQRLSTVLKQLQLLGCRAQMLHVRFQRWVRTWRRARRRSASGGGAARSNI